jgi:hypothetical protein
MYIRISAMETIHVVKAVRPITDLSCIVESIILQHSVALCGSGLVVYFIRLCAC